MLFRKWKNEKKDTAIEGWPPDPAWARAQIEEIRNGRIVEIGVWRGASLIPLLEGCRKNGNRVWAVDIWLDEDGSPPALPPQHFGHPSWPMSRERLEIFKTNLHASGHEDLVEIICDTSSGAASRFEDRFFDYAYIDACHEYECVKCDLLQWLPKLKPGGMMAGDDYNRNFPGVVRAVDEIFGPKVRSRKGKTWFVRIDDEIIENLSLWKNWQWGRNSDQTEMKKTQ